jgi:predicted Zn finger-like uncharacterized protein
MLAEKFFLMLEWLIRRQCQTYADGSPIVISSSPHVPIELADASENLSSEIAPACNVVIMRKSGACPQCRARFRRIELSTEPVKRGEFRCWTCNHFLELCDGSREVALRLTVQPGPASNGKPMSD